MAAEWRGPGRGNQSVAAVAGVGGELSRDPALAAATWCDQPQHSEQHSEHSSDKTYIQSRWTGGSDDNLDCYRNKLFHRSKYVNLLSEL